MVFFLSFRIQKMSVSAAQTTFWVYSGLVGLSLASIFLVYTGQSIVQTFFISAAAFGALSLWGYTTRRDLSGMGSFLYMGLVGVLIAIVVNLFLQSSALQFAISAGGCSGLCRPDRLRHASRSRKCIMRAMVKQLPVAKRSWVH